MRRLLCCCSAALLLSLTQAAGAADTASPTAAKPKASADILAAATAGDWRTPDPQNTVYLELPAGRVVMELAPAFAPAHVENIRTLVRAHYFDGLAVLRVQDNYVAQWGDPDEKRDLGKINKKTPDEYFRPLTDDLPFSKLADGDIYAAEVGWSNGFPAARDPKTRQAWLTHCYAMVGVGRGDAPDNGSGAELYTVIGQAPRHLDRNLAVVGRIIQGIELLSSLPRGTEALGFYAKPEQYVTIRSATLAADVPETQRSHIRLLRTDTPTWQAYVESRRNRHEDFFVEPTGHVDLCNVPLPVKIDP
jgi:peptidylprolyl isomerase